MFFTIPSQSPMGLQRGFYPEPFRRSSYPAKKQKHFTFSGGLGLHHVVRASNGVLLRLCALREHRG